MPRPVNKIAAEIDTLLRDIRQSRNPMWVTTCRPYVSAMLNMRTFSGWYGIDEAAEVGNNFLVAARAWTGPDARRIKEELRLALKEARNVHH